MRSRDLARSHARPVSDWFRCRHQSHAAIRLPHQMSCVDRALDILRYRAVAEFQRQQFVFRHRVHLAELTIASYHMFRPDASVRMRLEPDGKSGAGTVSAVTDLVQELAEGVRGARQVVAARLTRRHSGAREARAPESIIPV